MGALIVFLVLGAHLAPEPSQPRQLSVLVAVYKSQKKTVTGIFYCEKCEEKKKGIFWVPRKFAVQIPMTFSGKIARGTKVVPLTLKNAM